MTEYKEKNYDSLDRPEILMYLFHPRPEMASKKNGANIYDIMIPVEADKEVGGRLHMGAKNFPNILFFHGNGEIASDYDMLGPIYNREGMNFLAVDYRGYGRSTGSPTVAAMMKDSLAIMSHIKSWLGQRDFTGPVFLMGRSLGSASALEIVSKEPQSVAGLIIESGFAFTKPLLAVLGAPVGSLGFEEKDGFGNLEKIQNYDGPTLIIHAEKDHIIPFSDGKALHEACASKEKTLLKIPKANHNDIFLHGFNEYIAAVKAFTESDL